MGHSVSPINLRSHRPGDIGWIVSRHGAVYAQEYGYDGRFEALVARIGADFLDRLEPSLEACWIAEDAAGRPLGSVMLVRARDGASGAVREGIAQLRLLLVEREARGLRIGERLVARCTEFSRAAGYRKIVLWTQADLAAARGIYRKAGYRIVATEPHHSFGHDLIAETWELDLA